MQTRLRALNSELASGAAAIQAWVKTAYGLELTFQGEVVECC